MSEGETLAQYDNALKKQAEQQKALDNAVTPVVDGFSKDLSRIQAEEARKREEASNKVLEMQIEARSKAEEAKTQR